MNFLNKWFNKRWVEARHQWDQDQCKVAEPYLSKTASGRGRPSSPGYDIRSKGMTFVMYPASGGHIVEYQSYNEKTDSYEGKLHIIAADDDIGQALGHIVTLEYLRK